jgi:hypothetical protein
MMSLAITSSFAGSRPGRSCPGSAEHIGETGAADFVGDHLGGKRHIVKNAGELTGCFRDAAFPAR